MTIKMFINIFSYLGFKIFFPWQITVAVNRTGMIDFEMCVLKALLGKINGVFKWGDKE